MFLTGYPDLPAPPSASPVGAPVYYDGHYRDEPVRISAFEAGYPTDPPVAVLVQVAETVGGRGSRTQDLVLRGLLTQMVIILLATGITWFGVWRGLRPLRQVSRDVSTARPDLTPSPPRTCRTRCRPWSSR